MDAHRRTPLFDVVTVLAVLRVQRATQSPRRRRRSQLGPYRAELVQLRQAGASLGELQFYLRQHHVAVARSTIQRYLGTLPEMQPQTMLAGTSPLVSVEGDAGAACRTAKQGGPHCEWERRGAR